MREADVFKVLSVPWVCQLNCRSLISELLIVRGTVALAGLH